MKVKFSTRMSKKTAIKLSIRHWQRMIRWAKKKNPFDAYHPESDDTMRDELGETLGPGYCSLCRKYAGCSGCPLFMLTGTMCGHPEHLYQTVVYSETYGEFVQNAQQMLAMLKELR